MSSRIRSEWGTLADRGTGHPRGGRNPLPCHVWVQVDKHNPVQAGLLVRWERDAQGWLGEVAIVGASGAPGIQLVPAERITPAFTTAPVAPAPGLE